MLLVFWTTLCTHPRWVLTLRVDQPNFPRTVCCVSTRVAVTMLTEQRNGGVVYTRLGKVAVQMSQAPLLYAGRAGGTWYHAGLYFMCFVFAYSWLMKDIIIFFYFKHYMFYPLSLPSGAWSTATTEICQSSSGILQFKCLSKLFSPSINFLVIHTCALSLVGCYKGM